MNKAPFRKMIRLLVSAAMIICFMSETKAYAEEDSGKSIIEECDTSVIYDMGHIKAEQLPVSGEYYENPSNPYSYLKAPSQLIHIGDYYFIADCYNNQILYTSRLGADIKEWRVMTNNVSLPHAIAGDGSVYLVTDTENNRVLVFERKNGGFQNTQKFENIGKRPHYVKYDWETKAFYVWSSMTGEMYIIRREQGTNTVFLDEVRCIKELQGVYVRSFTIAGEQILFPSGDNSSIIIADKNTFEVQMRFPVVSQIAGMAQIMPIGSYFYLTVITDSNYNQSMATIIRTKDLSSLADGVYEEIYDKFQSKGIPYCMEYMNGMYYIACPGPSKSIWHFGVANDVINNVGAVY